MKKQRITADLKKVRLNTGQIDWLPKNPREWKNDDLERTKRSIERDPDFQEDRPLLLVEDGKGNFVTFGGNLRASAAKELKRATFEGIVYTPETDEDYETIKRRALLDNGSFGKNDYDALANEWTEFDLVELGLTTWEDETEAEGGGGGASEPSAQEDDFDENQDGILVRCKPGDIWELGDHRLMCGDSIDLEQVKTLMGGGIS